MTLATTITLEDFGELVEAAFHPETPVVVSSESGLGEPLEHFDDPAAILSRAAHCIDARTHHYAFGFWYPSMKGRTLERKVVLDPPREGQSFRYSWSGWGIIHLHLYASSPGTLQCRLAVNSESRARSRESRYPELGPAAEWDWRVVETCAFRLSRRLASMGPTAPVAPPPAA